MSPMESKGLLGRLFGFRDKDPLWEGFVNRPLSDPSNDLGAAIRSAPEGAVYPVKTEVPDPAGMSANMKDLGCWLGVDVVGITRLQPSQVRPEKFRDGQGERSAEEIARDYPIAIICGVQTEHDPGNTEGMAGRVSTLEGNLVSFNLAAFIRELGYRASFGGADAIKVAEAAGLGRLGADGRFTAPGKKGWLYISDPILTELPMEADPPAR